MAVPVHPRLAGVGRLEVYQAKQLVLAEERWLKRGPTRGNSGSAYSEETWGRGKHHRAPNAGVECGSLVAEAAALPMRPVWCCWDLQSDQHRLVGRVRWGASMLKLALMALVL